MTTGPNPDGPLQPEVLERDGDGDQPAPPGEAVTSPTKLIRIASMVRSLLDEARRAPLDDAGRRLLAEIHHKSLTELEGVLSDELRAELAEVSQPFESDDADRLGAAHRPGAARRLARRPVPRHPGNALHPAGMAAERQFEEMRSGGRMLRARRARAPATGAYL